jgi:hypothetical protein
MSINISKFIHTTTGKYVMSVLLGFGLASLFRQACKGRKCIIEYAAPLEEDEIHRIGNKCVRFHPVPTICDNTKRILDFE